MSSDFDQFAGKLQEAVFEDMRRDYSEKVIELFLNPRNLGRIEGADGHGRVTGSCGDTMEIFLKIKNDEIVDATFITDGCGPSLVCGSTVTELAKGQHIRDALKLSSEKVLEEIGCLPEADQHCAKLAADTLQDAIFNYSKREEEWG